MYSFVLALQFLTRLPVPFSFSATGQQLGRSVLFYPLVGLIIGLLLSSAAISLPAVHPPLQTALILTFWVLLTGGLHLDGLADCADAWAGGLGDRDKSLRIMKDPSAGPIAVIVLLLTLMLKWSTLQALMEGRLGMALLMAPVLGRTAILGLMVSASYVSKGGLAENLLKNLPLRETQAMIVFIALAAMLSIGILPVLLAIAMAAWIRMTGLRRLGGMTGDVYGAAVELVEVAVLMGCISYD